MMTTVRSPTARRVFDARDQLGGPDPVAKADAVPLTATSVPLASQKPPPGGRIGGAAEDAERTVIAANTRIT